MAGVIDIIIHLTLMHGKHATNELRIKLAINELTNHKNVISEQNHLLYIALSSSQC